MYKILIAILISILVPEMAFGHFHIGRRRDATKSALHGKAREMHVNYDVKNALRKADADLLGIRELLNAFARQEKQDRGENSWRQDRDEQEGEYQRDVKAERSSRDDYASMNSDDENKVP